MKRIWQYCRPMKGKIIVEMLVKFSGTVMDLLLPLILSHIIDEVVPLENIPLVALWGGVMLVCSGLSLLGNVIANRMAADVSRVVTRQLRHDLYSKISRLSCEQVDEVGIPSLEARLTSDTYNVHQLVSSMQRIGIRSPIIIVGGLLLMALRSPRLALAMGATLPLVVLVVVLVNRYGIPLYTATQRKVDTLVCTVRENSTGARVIKALSKTQHEKERFAQVNDDVTASEKRASTIMAVSNPLMNVILNCALVAVVVLAAYGIQGGSVKPGTLIAFMTYFTIVLNALLSINRVFVMLSKGTASANRISSVLDLDTEADGAPQGRVDTDFHVQFDHVAFSYKKVKNNLEDVDFALKRGQTLGIIGPTGCGKSTILNLLLRFYDVDSGAVRIDGEDIRGMSLEALRAHFGTVLQNDVLFADTVEENVSFGRNVAADGVRKAIRYAQADFVDGLEGGAQFELAPRGSNLSGGQKQRLLIARALADAPDILLLDDASSALDYQTDANLRKTLGERYAHTTKIIVTQRVSSILRADCILVLEEGRVIGKGTHEELLENCSEYRNIAQMQMGSVAYA